MKFYDALQLDPAILKRKIAACDTKQEKARYWVAMAVRSALIVAFAIVFISLLSGVFGADNTPLAVALFCMMLGIRFVLHILHRGFPGNAGRCAGHPGAGARRGGAASAGAADSAAFRGFLCPAVHDVPAAGDGQRRPVQLCLYLPHRQSGAGRGAGAPRASGAGGIPDLRRDPGCQTPRSAQNHPVRSCGAQVRSVHPGCICGSFAWPWG